MSGLPPDPYKILGVVKDATQPDIRSAYKKLVLKCHPDKVQDPALKNQKQDEFQKVQQAYELLNNEAERQKYDEKVKLVELKEQAKKYMGEHLPKTPIPRTPPTQHFAYMNVNVRTAEPRTNSSPRYGPPPQHQKVYQYHTTSHSFEDDMHTKSKVMYEEGPRRRASYEKPSKREEEKRDARRRREREEEYEREKERREREARRVERKRQEKERKRESDEKHRRKSPYVEPYDDVDAEDVYVSKSEKKKTSTKKHDIPREKSKGREPSPRRENDSAKKMEDFMGYAVDYMDRRGNKPPPKLGRSQTFQEPATYNSPPVAVPSPPPVHQYVDDDAVYRSSARASSRRASHDIPLRPKEKARRSPSREPVIVDADPMSRGVPPLRKSHTTPPIVPESPPRGHIPRANTTQEYRSNPNPPPMARASTFHSYAAVDPDPRPRRGSHQAYDDDSEEDWPARHRSRRARSPEPVQYRTTYQVNDGKTQRMDHYRDESPSARKSHKYGTHPKVVDAHPSMPHPRDPVYGNYPGPAFKVKTSKSYAPEDVTYSPVQHTAQREMPYAYA